MATTENEFIKKLKGAKKQKDLDSYRATLGDIYGEYRFLMAYCASQRLSRPEDIMDAVDEAFLCFIKAANAGKIKHLKAYLYQVTDHVALEMAKRVSRESESYEDSAQGFIEELGMDEAVLEALNELNDRERRIVILRAVAELSFLEIGHIMGLTVVAADSLYRRAIKKLKKRMGSVYEKEEH